MPFMREILKMYFLREQFWGSNFENVFFDNAFFWERNFEKVYFEKYLNWLLIGMAADCGGCWISVSKQKYYPKLG